MKEPSRYLAPRFRALAILLHRWVGLAISLFLIVAGATGSIIAFYRPLDAALNPELFRVEPPSEAAQLLEPIELFERIQAQLPTPAKLEAISLELRANESVSYWIEETETFFDPYTAQLLGSRKFGDLSQGKKNLLTFIYQLHFSLGLGRVGIALFGAVAVLWTLDCFVGAYLTLPVRVPGQSRSGRASFFKGWMRAWQLKMRQLFSFIFTWHRASGLWLWGLLLVFAWSAVGLNLRDEVYNPVMGSLLGPSSEPLQALLAVPREQPLLNTRAALKHARELLAAEATRRGFVVLGERSLSYHPESGSYEYRTESTLDISERLAETTLSFDGNDGVLLALSSPTSQGARTTLDHWLVALHFGAVRAVGIGYRTFVAVFGVLVVALSISGLWIWWVKLGKRRRGKANELA